MVSKGAAELARICAEDPRGQVGVAERLGEHQSLVSRWCTGERTPSADRRVKLEDVLGIGWRLWSEPSESSEPMPETERAP